MTLEFAILMTAIAGAAVLLTIFALLRAWWRDRRTIADTLRDVIQRKPVKASEIDRLMQHVERRRAERAKRLPDETACIHAIQDAYARMQELGWKEPRYLRQHANGLVGIQLGTTGIFEFSYLGEWPRGNWMLSDGEDFYPDTPLMVRPRRPGDLQ